MKKLLLLIFTLVISHQIIAQAVVLDANGVTIKYTGTSLPTPYLIQASPRGTLEWFAIVDNTTKVNITDYAKGIQSGITYFTPTGSSTPITFNNIVTTLVTNMSDMFFRATSFNQPIDSWNVSNVTDMSDMFFRATSFNQPIDSWNVSNVTNMAGMFFGATAFNQPIGSWDVSNVTNMNSMFREASVLHQNISSWNVSNVTDMDYTFGFATNFNQPIGSWNVSNVNRMNGMFSNAPAFNQNIGSWNVSNVTNMIDMFYNTNNFPMLSSANYDALLIGWSTIIPPETPLKPGVTFKAAGTKFCNGVSGRAILTSVPNNWTITDGGLDCSSLIVLDTNGITLKYTGTSLPSPYLIQASPRGTLEWFAIVDNTTKINISNYAKNIQSGKTYFTPTGSSTPIPFNNIVTTLVTDMSEMFFGSNAFNQNIESWDVSKVTNMDRMVAFSSFNQPIGNWNVINVTNMSAMFDFSLFNQPIGNWNVSNVTNMSLMFYASSFSQPIGNWNVSNVTNMSSMFAGGSIFSSFNQPIGNWNVSNVTNMSLMFSGSPFNQPIDNWNVSNVTNMSSMFAYSPFNQPIGNWNVSNVNTMSEMFTYSPFNQPIGNWNVSNVNTMSEMFTGAKLSTANYDATLIGWSIIISPETPLKSNIPFSGGYSTYCNGASARNLLMNTYGWTIQDSGLNCADLDTEEFEANSLKLYPNPVLSILNVKTDYNLINQPYTIVDGLGRVVLNGKINEVESTINVEQLSKGIYYLKISDKNASKFIKE